MGASWFIFVARSKEGFNRLNHSFGQSFVLLDPNHADDEARQPRLSPLPLHATPVATG
jgi:hypothetical protein